MQNMRKWIEKNRLFNLKSHLLQTHEISISGVETNITGRIKNQFRKQSIKMKLAKNNYLEVTSTW